MRSKALGMMDRARRPGTFSLPWRTTRSIGALILREMTATYGRSPGGYIWALLEPIGGVLILTLVISEGLSLRKPALGVSFAMFYATGVLAFGLYGRVQIKVAQALFYSRALLRYPAVRFFDAIAARFLLNVLTQMAVMMIVFGGIMLLFETRAYIDLPAILLSIAMAAAFGLGVGMLNMVFMAYSPVYTSIFQIATTPLFLISGIFFLYEDMPRAAQNILWYNPILHAIAMMRRGFYAQYEAEFVSPLYVFTVALVLMVLGFVLISRFHRQIMARNFS